MLEMILEKSNLLPPVFFFSLNFNHFIENMWAVRTPIFHLSKHNEERFSRYGKGGGRGAGAGRGSKEEEEGEGRKVAAWKSRLKLLIC